MFLTPLKEEPEIPTLFISHYNAFTLILLYVPNIFKHSNYMKSLIIACTIIICVKSLKV